MNLENETVDEDDSEDEQYSLQLSNFLLCCLIKACDGDLKIPVEG